MPERSVPAASGTLRDSAVRLLDRLIDRRTRLPPRPGAARPLGLCRPAVDRRGDLPRRGAGLGGSGHRRTGRSSSRRWRSPPRCRHGALGRCTANSTAGRSAPPSIICRRSSTSCSSRRSCTSRGGGSLAVRRALHPRHRDLVAAPPGRAAGCWSPRSGSCSTSPTSFWTRRARRSRSASGCSSACSPSWRSAAGYLSAKLQGGAGAEELDAELAHVRLQAADILRNIRSGIVTVDARGPAALRESRRPSSCSAIDLEQPLGRPVLDRAPADRAGAGARRSSARCATGPHDARRGR